METRTTSIFVAGLLWGGKLASDLFIICLVSIHCISTDLIKDNDIPLKKGKKETIFLKKTITGAYYADHIALLANAPNQAVSLLYSLKLAADGIGINVSVKKVEYMCIYQEGAISTLKDCPPINVDKFAYFGKSVSSTKSELNIRPAKAWNVIDKLMIIEKFDRSDKLKRDFFQIAAVCTRMLRIIWNKSWTNNPRNSNYTATYFPSQKHPSKGMRDSARKTRAYS